MSNYLFGQQFRIGPTVSTVIADMDFETYSEAGYVYDTEKKQYVGAMPKKRGLELVGSAVYAEHSSTEVLSLAYDLKDGLGSKLWVPRMPPPSDLFEYIKQGGLIEAHNSFFEYLIWFFVCQQRMGWPELPLEQLRCSMSKAKAYSLPGKLEAAAKVVGATELKDSAGTTTMRKLSVPRKPTKKNGCLRWTPELNPKEFQILYNYNIQDIKAEAALSLKVPDLQPQELALWLLDQRINARGVYVDSESLNNCISIFQQIEKKYLLELRYITSNQVNTASELEKIRKWLALQGIQTPSLDEEGVELLLNNDNLPPHCRRVLEIRKSLAASSVKKLFALKYQRNSDSRIRGLFAFCGADRTGRFAGRGPQPQNLPNSGPKVRECDPINGCGNFYGSSLKVCPFCSTPEQFSNSKSWSLEVMDYALQSFKTSDLNLFEKQWGEGLDILTGSLRGLFTAAPGYELMGSDYSAIEGVVAAMLAGEQWRIDVFRDHGKIYEMSAVKITGITFEEIIEHKMRTGEDHPLRKTIGKVAELASGFGGWIGAWKRFGADQFMDDQQIKESILAWRAASPAIVEMWGGQHRKNPHRWEFTPELFGLEGAAILALQHPGQCFDYRSIKYTFNTENQVLYCRLLSGRFIHYHNARLEPHIAKNGMPEYQIVYEGPGDNKSGAWVTMYTYGGKLFENVVQATARDILAHAMLNLDAVGYPIVLHIHDEIIAEVLEGQRSIEELETIMEVMPDWAYGWPIKAAGGWRGKRYRKG